MNEPLLARADAAYADALNYLYSLPDWERGTGGREMRAAAMLERPAALLARLGAPQQNYRTVLVAGSKGKGSTCAMLESILRAAGQRTGFSSKPHLHSYRERMRLAGEPIGRAEFADALARLKPHVAALERAHPDLGAFTTFEVTIALALDYFARQRVDVAVIEVGLGGRLDATNVVDADVAVITPLSFEHTAVLGNTLGAIAAEKAGIIKYGKPVLSAPQQPQARAVLETIAAERNATLGLGGRDWSWAGERADFRVTATDARAGLWHARWEHAGLKIPLLGAHQIENAALALAAARVLAQTAALVIPPAAVAEGLAQVRWHARIEVAGRADATRPAIIVDGAHNGDSAEKLVAALRANFQFERVYLVLGVYGDKNLPAIVEPFLPFSARVWTAKTRQPRSLPAVQVAEALKAMGVDAAPAANTAEALRRAREYASARDLICVAGSLSIAAEAREALGLVAADERD